jgi:hypothetical protein
LKASCRPFLLVKGDNFNVTAVSKVFEVTTFIVPENLIEIILCYIHLNGNFAGTAGSKR